MGFGQENFRSVTQPYFKNSVCALVVYDITNRETFNDVQSRIDDFKTQSPKSILVLVGTKEDLAESNRQVSYKEGREFAKKNKMLFFEASSKTGYNIEEVFVKSARVIAEKIEKGEYDLSDGSCGIRVGNLTDASGKEITGTVIKKTENNCNSQNMHSATMKKLRFKKVSSYLKMSLIILNKELSEMKKKNDDLNQKVKELESTRASIFQRTITKKEMKEMIKEGFEVTKKEMKEMIKEGLASFSGKFKEKEKEVKDTQTQTLKDNIDKLFTSIKLCKYTGQQHQGWVTYILELSDGKIAVGCTGGSISLNLLNYETKEWKVLTQKDKAHDDYITSLCEINNKRIISSSFDTTLKIWNIASNNSIQLLRTLSQHKAEVWKVIPLTGNRFASCSSDCTVKLWNSDTYEQIRTPFEKQTSPWSIVQLKRQQEVIVISCCSTSNQSLHFYRLCQPYILLGTINNVCTTISKGLIELANGHVAVSHSEPNCIYIVDPETYELVATITDKDYIPIVGPLYAFGIDSLIYVSLDGGHFCEITMKNEVYKICIKTKESDIVLHGNCVCTINAGKYIISSNKYKGCSLFSYSY